MKPNSYLPDSAQIFIKFLITPEAISGPIYQEFEYQFFATTPNEGQMKFSQDGTRIVFTKDFMFDVYSFDRCSGELELLEEVLTNDTRFYGCEFSYDHNYIYISTEPSNLNENLLFQYCLSCPEPLTETQELIYHCELEDYGIGQLQLAPDGKIYFPIMLHNGADPTYSDFNQFLCVINDPSAEGLACDLDTLSTPLDNSRVTYALPNMPNYSLGALVGSPCDSLILPIDEQELLEGFLIYPNPASDILNLSNVSHTEQISYCISDITGRILLSAFLDTSHKIVVDAMTPGIYFLTLNYSGSDRRVCQFIISE